MKLCGSRMLNLSANRTGASDNPIAASATNACDQRPAISADTIATASAIQIARVIQFCGKRFISAAPALHSRAETYHIGWMRAENNPKPIRLASYNIRKCVGLDRRRAPGRTLDVITNLDADIIALQEADRRLGPRPAALPRQLIERASDFQTLEIGEGPDSIGWHGNAILVRKGTILLASERLHLPGLEPRGAVIADLAFGNRTLRLVATHLGLMRRHRTAQLAMIRAAISARPDLPTVILGDFNEWNGGKGLEPLQDAFTIHAPGHSFHAARPVAALDRIALGRGITLQDAGVRQTGLALRASDHLPIWADISLPAPSACD